MRKKFDWYLKPTEEELGDIWTNGILTVDANVLLDLYRYHQATRDSILSSIEAFEGRKWLSNQAATEFFRNRTKVICASEKAFSDAQKEIETLSGALDSTVEKLKGNRIVPAGLAGQLGDEIKPLIQKVRSAVEDARRTYPNFLQEDPVLLRLLALFDGSVGDDFKDEDRRGIEEQAEKRRKGRIPPGYLDDDKEGNRPHGDYYLWRQILDHARTEGRAVILVTSERKEDWWERVSGKTIGPRSELLQEAKQASGQRILIYQTERFLEYSSKRSRQPVNTEAVEEIRARGKASLLAARRILGRVKEKKLRLPSDKFVWAVMRWSSKRCQSISGTVYGTVVELETATHDRLGLIVSQKGSLNRSIAKARQLTNSDQWHWVGLCIDTTNIEDNRPPELSLQAAKNQWDDIDFVLMGKINPAGEFDQTYLVGEHPF